jgi:hypothetical protein
MYIEGQQKTDNTGGECNPGEHRNFPVARLLSGLRGTHILAWGECKVKASEQPENSPDKKRHSTIN